MTFEIYVIRKKVILTRKKVEKDLTRQNNLQKIKMVSIYDLHGGGAKILFVSVDYSLGRGELTLVMRLKTELHLKVPPNKIPLKI